MRKIIEVALAASMCVGMMSLAAAPALSRRVAQSEQFPVGAVAAIAMEAVGLSPNAAVVAACSPQEVDQVLDWMLSPATETTALVVAISAESQARTLLGTLQASARDNPSPENLTALVSQEATVQSASAVVAQAKALLRAALDTELGRPVSATLLQAQASLVAGLPAEFGAIEHSRQQTQQLQLALKAEHRAERFGASLESKHAQSLQSVRSEEAVIAAKQRLVSGRDPMQAVFSVHEVQ